ncbi:hypothetical protein FM755_05795 [Francisella tularensis]|uniref:Uncharacterized protein n=6 Tax=Francisella tularensis TaxID=263 RepID=A0A6B0K342_FRATU|nr:hypothetical protein [Francisella tularensis]AFX70171.1 hypothetical protein F92_02520 [Francisella tularensis subsp. holarctica F92]ABU60966.1 hypothetical membrane protein [Francisella tularensis subsp. holarctica FTNF002-00]AJI66755.1 putative membrane protein [Francisella tularensis subsp. holarctica]AKO69162.1 hypothetical protein AAX59_08060 [Francisella tularensis subsp. holarctica]AUP74969.1 hypothetical protein CYL81_02395 [Francisella tularensis]
MFNNYNLLTTNLFVVYLILRIFTFLPKRLLLLAILILLCFNFISITYDNQTIFYFVTGFINYFSFSSFILLIFIIATTFASKRITIFPYTSIAFLLIIFIFYGSFFIVSYSLYDIGYSAYLVLACVFAYGLILLVISNRFILFNIIIVITTVAYFSGILQGNIWDYLLDPILLVICIIEISRALITTKNKQHKDKIIYY